MLIGPAVSVTPLDFSFGCADTYRFSKNDGNQAQLFGLRWREIYISVCIF